MNQTGIGARPYFSGVQRRWRNGIHSSVAKPLRVLSCDRPGVGSRRLLPRKVGADSLPVQAAVNCLHHILCTQVKSISFDRREDKHRSPRIAILALRHAFEDAREHWRWRNVLALSRAPVKTLNRAKQAGDIKDVGIFRIGRDPAALAAADGEAVARIN